MKRKIISVLTPCYNEEGCIYDCYQQVKTVFDKMLPQYDLEHVFIDNHSSDKTVSILKDIAMSDSRVKIIVNSRNFGLSRSPYYGMLQTTGDAVVPVVADLQTPPLLIVDFVNRWEQGYKMVIAVRKGSRDGFLVQLFRNFFYQIISRLSTIQQIKHFIGFGLFDKRCIQIMRDFDDPCPYFRGIVSEIGFDKTFIEYVQPPRKFGKSRHSFFDLFELAMLGITSYSKAPLRLMSLVGFTLAGFSLLISIGYFIVKIFFWNVIEMGIAPIIIGIFFFASVQLFFLGIVGEYVGLIYEQTKKRPLVIEQERINFD